MSDVTPALATALALATQCRAAFLARGAVRTIDARRQRGAGRVAEVCSCLRRRDILIFVI